MSTPTVSLSGPGAPDAAAGPRRRLVGLALLLVGLGVFISSLFLPWVTKTCIANCAHSGLPPSGVGLGPLSHGLNYLGFTLACTWPCWVLVAVVTPYLVRQEFLPAPRQRALPALMLAGLFAVGVPVALFVTSLLNASVSNHLTGEVDSQELGPGSAVSLVGIALFAVGGWLRYHPIRRRSPLAPADPGAIPATMGSLPVPPAPSSPVDR